MSRVCEKHGQYCPDGVCKWCEPDAEAEGLPQFGINPRPPIRCGYSLWRAQSGAPGAPWVDFVLFQQAMNAVWGQLAATRIPARTQAMNVDACAACRMSGKEMRAQGYKFSNHPCTDTD